MIPNPCIEVQTSPVDRPSVPAWFAEVVLVVQHLATNGLLEAFAHHVCLVRKRFGTYEPIDFLALLISYAMSGERTLVDFFERVEPFEAAFMALFGRSDLPHRSSLSRFLVAVDHPCLEAFRTLFEKQRFASEWTSEIIGGIFDRQGRRILVFDVDATRQAARQRALPTAPELPLPRRRLRARLHWAQAWRSRPYANNRPSNAYASMDWHLCKSWEWRLPGRIGLGPWSHCNVFEIVCSHRRCSSGPPRWTV